MKSIKELEAELLVLYREENTLGFKQAYSITKNPERIRTLKDVLEVIDEIPSCDENVIIFKEELKARIKGK